MRSALAHAPRPERPAFDITSVPYQEVREAFRRALNQAVGMCTRAELADAMAILGLAEAQSDDEVERVSDVALYSRPGNPFARQRRKRPIDRIAPKLAKNLDPLAAEIARHLPNAFYTVCEVRDGHPDGGVVVNDLMNEGRPLHLMDVSLAISAPNRTLFGIRLLDLGAWHVGFGIVDVLRRSEAAAILLASSPTGAPGRSDCLHELVYAARLNDLDLVTLALEPVIGAISAVVDADDMPLLDRLDQVASFFQVLGEE